MGPRNGKKYTISQHKQNQSVQSIAEVAEQMFMKMTILVINFKEFCLPYQEVF